jgi:hypothetical protein
MESRRQQCSVLSGIVGRLGAVGGGVYPGPAGPPLAGEEERHQAGRGQGEQAADDGQ